MKEELVRILMMETFLFLLHLMISLTRNTNKYENMVVETDYLAFFTLKLKG